jgi:pimeloyl-ACP methyl ester carboxylesterase
MGISYGTHVALQYARTFPQRTERLILDSIVGPDGPDPFLLDTYRHLPRVLREQCAGGACRGVTADPVGDARAFAERLARGPVRGQARDRRGRLRPVAYRSQEEALYLLLAGDLNPFVQAALPAALASARAGDDALLLALHRAAAGPRTPLADLSFGLNVTTGCTDGGTPWPLSAPPQQRRAEEQQSLAAVAPGDYAPFQAATVLASGYGDDCLLWPRDVVRAPSAAPLPDVPALLLGGGLDLRTPAENAAATAALLPRAQVVRLAGSGHDVLDSDVTGCAARALARFAAGQAVGRPCAGKDDAVRPLPLPPPSLDVFRAAAGVPGRRGRVLSATVETAQDAQIGMLQDLLAGVAIGRGGLRGGSYAGAGGDGIVLRDYEYLRGLRVSGRLAGGAGALRVRGLASGRVRIGRDGAVRGTLDGHRVRSRPARGAAAARRVRGLRVDGPSLDPGPWLGDRLRALLRRREVARARP